MPSIESDSTTAKSTTAATTTTKTNHNVVDFQERFPSAQETLEYAKLSKIVYHVNSVDDPNLTTSQYKLQHPITCHYFGENKMDTQVMIVSCDYSILSDHDESKASSSSSHHHPHQHHINYSTNQPYDGYIAVVYRGTSSSFDIAVDANVTLVPFDIPFVDDEFFLIHSGFNEAFRADNLHDIVTIEQLDLVRAVKPNHKIVFCGHSLGAALSTLGAVYTACRLPNVEILCVNFGSPRVGTMDFKKYVDYNVNNCAVWRCVLEDDIVTRSPPASLGYEHIGHLLDLDRQRGALALFLHLGCRKRGYRGVDPKSWDIFPDSSLTSAIEDHKCYNYISYLEEHLAKYGSKYFPHKFSMEWDMIADENDPAEIAKRRRELLLLATVPVAVVLLVVYASRYFFFHR